MTTMANTPSEILRCFIAAQLTNEARQQLSRLQDRLHDILPANTVRWTPPVNIHLTLHFLGNLQRSRLERVGQILLDQAPPTHPFTITLTGLGCFPNPRRPRIVWVGIGGEKEPLLLLQKRLGKALKHKIGFQPEPRPFSPHLTIGRVKKAVGPQRLRHLGAILEEQFPTVGDLAPLRIETIHLMESELKPAGPVYTSLAHAKLG